MKTIINFWSILGLLILSIFSPSKSGAQDLTGFWAGKVDLPTVKLTLIFEFAQPGNDTVKLDIPEQEANDLIGTILKVSDDSLVFRHEELNRTFYGEFLNGSTVKGNWEKNKISIPVTLNKTETPPTLKRPQSPQPPFPYLSEEVEYINSKSGLKLAGTLTIPKKADGCPAVVLITGSGAQDRDETIFGHKQFFVIADYFARNGIAVLRVDDRGVGGSEGNIAVSTSEEFADDALAGINFLKTQKEIDSLKIGLIGHSEGGLIAPIAATTSNDVAFFIMMAGPGMIGEQILSEQNDLALSAAGMPEYVVKQNRAVQKTMFDVLKNEPDSALAHRELQIKLSQGFYDGMNNEMKAQVDGRIKGINSKWFRYFLTYNPQPTLSKVRCPVLALNGVKDLQVPVSNLEAIEKAVKSGGNENVTVIAFENLNHLFQNCTTGAVAEYSQIEETIDPEVLEIMKDWILEVSSK